ILDCAGRGTAPYTHLLLADSAAGIPKGFCLKAQGCEDAIPSGLKMRIRCGKAKRRSPYWTLLPIYFSATYAILLRWNLWDARTDLTHAFCFFQPVVLARRTGGGRPDLAPSATQNPARHCTVFCAALPGGPA